MPINYPNAISRTVAYKTGDYPSFLDFGTTDGTTDVSATMNKAIASVTSQGRGTLYVPGGTYVISNPVTINSAIKIYGDPQTTIFVAGGSITSGMGMFDITSGNVTLQDFIIDGNVTTPAGILYSSIGTPKDSALEDNTSIWIHGSSSGPLSNFIFDNITIQHTGGYALFADATNGELFNFQVKNCLLQNNRPHLFGTTTGDLSYGSWTGGIFIAGDGSANMVHDILISGNRWKCNTGNGCWMWAPALSYLHTNFRAIHNSFEDQGLDAIETGALNGGTVANNTFRRIGYVSLTDNTVGAPKWLAGKNATGIDTSGLVINVSYTGNSGISTNGSAIDLDCFGSGTITGNSFRIPGTSDPEYTIDQISTFGPASTGQNWCAAINANNSQDTAQGGFGNIASGNSFTNYGGGINWFAQRNGTVSGNLINHPANAQGCPITIGISGSGTYQTPTGNVITGNTITWAPSGVAPVVLEEAFSFAYTSTDVNVVYGNSVPAALPEFQKDPNSGSTTQQISSTQSITSAGASPVRHIHQTTGVDAATANLAWYTDLGSGLTKIMDVNYNTASPYLTVYGSGFAVSGSTAYNTVKTSGGMYAANGYTADQGLYLKAAYASSSTGLNTPGSGYAGLAYKSGTTFWVYDTTTSTWTPCDLNGSGSGSVTGSDTWIQYNSGGSSFGSDGNFVWTYASQVLKINAVASTPGIDVLNGYISSDGGYQTTSTAFNSIQSTGGFLVANGTIFDSSGSGVSKLLIKAGAGQSTTYTFEVQNNAGATQCVMDDAGNISALGSIQLTSSSSGLNLTAATAFNSIESTGGFLVANGTIFDSSVSGISKLLIKAGAGQSTNYTLEVQNNSGVTQCVFDDAGNISALGLLQLTGSSGGMDVTTSTAFNSIQSSGGLYSQSVTNDGVYFSKSTTSPPSESTTTYGGLLHRSGTQWNLYNPSTTSWTTVDFATVGGGVTSLTAGSNISVSASTGAVTVNALPSGPPGSLQYNDGPFGGNSFLVWDNTNKILAVTALSSSVYAIHNATGYILSDNGFNTPSTSTSAINALSGGVTAKFLIGTTSLSVEADTSTNAGLSSSGEGRIYFDSSTDKFRVSENGGAYVNLVGSGGGVTSLTAGTGISVSASTGPVTVTNTGVTSLIAGTGVSLTSSTGAITISSTAGSVAGSNGDVQFNSSGSFGASANITWDNTNKILEVFGTSSGVHCIYANTGYILSDAGYNTGSTAFNAIQAPSGGIYAGGTTTGITSDGPYFSKSTISVPSESTTTYGGLLHRSGSVWNYWNPAVTSWGTVDLSLVGVSAVVAGAGISVASGGGGSYTIANLGVRSLGGLTGAVNLVGGTGVSVSATTISIGQNVATSSSVTFGSLSIGSTLCLSSGGIFEGNGVGCPLFGVQCAGVNPWHAATSTQYFGVAFSSFQDLAGNTHQVVGGIIVS